MLAISILIALLAANSALAGLYGTRPVANTVFSAGRTNTVTWINDNSRPSLQDLGPIRIDLYFAGDNYVATLAKDVDPTSRSQKVWISPTWGPNGSDYHMRFICDDPPITVYSAEFTLTDMSDTRPYDGAEQAMTQSAPTDTSPASISTAILKFGPLNTTMVSTSTSTITRPSTAATGTPPPISDQNEDPYIKNKKTGASSGSLWKRTAVDLERIKFRVVFILWPALVGITMAL